MNKDKRHRISIIIEDANKIKDLMETLSGSLNEIYEEEEETCSNLEERFSETQNYQASAAAVEELSTAQEVVEEIINQLYELVEILDDAKG